ncbi:AAA-like domain-containing protein [candidate division KSB1 bacterium]|nr:AAA-like domain-containing protein [candidate division KSB1 bacterium]
MPENPYKFLGPLNPVINSSVLVKRREQLDEVITGIFRGDYWAILGPRQIGKTTFIQQLHMELGDIPNIYLYMSNMPDDPVKFFSLVNNKLRDLLTGIKIDSDTITSTHFGPEIDFVNYLKTLAADLPSKLIFFIDEIEHAPLAQSFLTIWRNIFNERLMEPVLNKFSVIVACSANLVELTLGPTSPFNIAQKLQLTNFTFAQAQAIMHHLTPFADTGILELIYFKTSGHPQLLQQLCSILYDAGMQTQKQLTDQDVEYSIYKLYQNSTNIDTLAAELKDQPELKKIILRMLHGERINFLPYDTFSITGAGPICESNGHCTFRSKLYQDYLSQTLLEKEPPTYEHENASRYHIHIYHTSPGDTIGSTSAEQLFLKSFLDAGSIEIDIFNNQQRLPALLMDWKEKMALLYMAYKSVKNVSLGMNNELEFPDQTNCLSSSLQNNEIQQPEWDIFLNKIKQRFPNFQSDDIRSWIYSIRRKLDKIEATDLIPQVQGRGKGYWLNAKVSISPNLN